MSEIIGPWNLKFYTVSNKLFMVNICNAALGARGLSRARITRLLCLIFSPLDKACRTKAKRAARQPLVPRVM